jgi:hypothetical protein
VPDDLYRTRKDPHVILDGEKLQSGGAGIFFHLPIFEAVGGSLSGEGSNQKLIYISAHNVETRWFLPNDSYFAQALRGVAVKKELLSFRQPSVFMVTGVKIAERATIVSGQKKSSGGEVGPEVDLTALGIPLDIGVKIRALQKEYSIVPIQKSNFVLAFETRRVRMKKNGYTEEDFNQFAMLDDEEGSSEELAESLHDKVDLGQDQIVSIGMEIDE